MSGVSTWSPAAPGTIITRELVLAQREAFTACLSELDLRGSRVAIAVADQPQFLGALSAARALGAVGTLLSSAAPTQRSAVELKQRIQRCDPHVIVVDSVHEAMIAELAEPAVGLLAIGSDGPRWARRPQDIPRDRCESDATLMVFTSGSTSMPKGVLLSRRNVDFALAAHANILEWTAQDTYLACLPLTHVLGTVNLASILAVGGRAVVSPGFMFPDRVVEACREHGVSVLSVVPYFLARLLSRGELAGVPARQVIVSSAPIVPADVGQLREHLPSLQILHTYGLTEAFRSTALAGPDVLGRLPSIGKPIAGVELQLRTEEGELLEEREAVGVAWLKGPNVMLGYYGEPQLTASALRDGWLCTADIMERSPDGYLTLKGRTAEVLNGGGEKLMCHEVEAIIFQRLKVEELMVLSVSSHQGCDHVVAVVAPSPGERPTLADVKRACVGRVHSVFIPRALVLVERLPRRENGKVDRAAAARIALEFVAEQERTAPPAGSAGA